jgi:glycolate oxidase
MLELMDRASVNAVEDHKPMGLDRSAGALLVAQSDAPGPARALEVEAVRAACEAAGATEVFVTDDPDEGEMFVEARRLAFPAVLARGSLLLEDVGVPVPLLPELLARIAGIVTTYDVEIPVVAHAGDGNTHPLVVYDPSSEERARQAFDAVMVAAIELGGTITGEHGVGRAKQPFLAAQLGPDVMALNRRVKDALDPLGILNPGAAL